MDRCELCQKELVPFSYRAPYGNGVICGACAEKQKGGKAAAPAAPAAAVPAGPAKAVPPPVAKAGAPAPPPAAKVETPKKAEGNEDDLSSALDSLLN